MNRSLAVIGTVVSIVIIGVCGPVIAQVGTGSKSTSNAGLKTARTYIRGLEQGKLEDLDRLFLPEKRSSILENTSDEGSWEQYRDHHLGPEMKESSGFKFSGVKESAQRFGTTIVVSQTGRFSVKVGEEDRSYSMAVTYVMVAEEGALRIGTCTGRHAGSVERGRECDDVDSFRFAREETGCPAHQSVCMRRDRCPC